MNCPHKLTDAYPHPANLGVCDFTGCKVISPKEWQVVEDKYACGIGYIKNSVIFSLPWGRGSESGMLKYVENMKTIFDYHVDHGKQIVIVDDFSDYSGISQKARKIYIQGLKTCPQIAGLVCYNLSAYFRFNLGIGRRLHIAPYPIEFRDNYKESIICASQILNRPIGKIDAQNLTRNTAQKTKAFRNDQFPLFGQISADTMHTEYRIVSEDTVLAVCSGVVTLLGIEETVAYRKKLMNAEPATQKLRYLMVEVNGLKEMPTDILAGYTKDLSDPNTSFNISLAILIGNQVFTNATEQFIKTRIPFSVIEAPSLDEALTSIECHRANSATPLDLNLPRLEEIQTKTELTETLVHILSNTRWQIPGTFKIAERYPPENELRILLDAFDTIKTDVDMTMAQQQHRLTELARASDEIKANEEQFRALFNLAADGILVINEKGTITDCNHAATVIFESTYDELMHKNASTFLPEIHLYLKDHNNGDNSINNKQTTAKRNQNDSFPAHISLRQIYIKQHPHTIAYIQDSSESVAVQQAILDTASRITRRIGSDLHDSLGQKLVGASYLAQAIIKSFDGKSPELKQKLTALLGVINSSVSETRALSHGLNPAEQSGGGLIAGISRFMYKSRKTYSIECDINIDLPEEDISHDTATHLYYILQESVNNAVRHGKASLITLNLKKADKTTGILTIEDNGTGFTKPVGAASSGIGMKLMRYRMDLIGGKFEYTSKPGKGVKLSYSFPLA